MRPGPPLPGPQQCKAVIRRIIWVQTPALPSETTRPGPRDCQGSPSARRAGPRSPAAPPFTGHPCSHPNPQRGSQARLSLPWGLVTMSTFISVSPPGQSLHTTEKTLKTGEDLDDAPFISLLKKSNCGLSLVKRETIKGRSFLFLFCGRTGLYLSHPFLGENFLS